MTERVKAQDPPDAVSDQHHLGDRAAPQGGWQAVGGPYSKLPAAPQTLTCPQKPAPSGERRKAAYAWLVRAMTAATALWYREDEVANSGRAARGTWSWERDRLSPSWL